MFLFVLYLPASVQSAYFPSKYLLSTFVLHSTEMSIRMLANLYKRLTTTTNALPTIRMACDWLQICCEWLQIYCEYAFLANFRSMFLIFVTPQNRARMLTKPTNAFKSDHVAIIANLWRMAFVSPFVLNFLDSVRAV